MAESKEFQVLPCLLCHFPNRVGGEGQGPRESEFKANSSGADKCRGQGKGEYLVIPTANAELATQAVRAGAVIYTRAVLR